MATLVTGAAGFIGFHTCKFLCERGDEVVGFDNLNDYYDLSLKRARLDALAHYPNFKFVQGSLEKNRDLEPIFRDFKITRVIHLAAQAGVRYSLVNPSLYIQSNVVGFQNIIENCRQGGIEHLTYASSSSVYGLNSKMPFSVEHPTNHPVSLYAASKKANELMAHSYSHLFNLPTTGIRFFTVYGPWGRPDMATFSFAKKILAGEPIELFNYGKMKRDFTYVDDIVEGVVKVNDKPAEPNPCWNSDQPEIASSSAPYRIYNIGNNRPVELMYMVELLEKYLGKEAVKVLKPMQDGDVLETFADVDALTRDVGFTPKTSIEDGLERFTQWYLDFYHCKRQA